MSINLNHLPDDDASTGIKHLAARIMRRNAAARAKVERQERLARAALDKEYAKQDRAIRKNRVLPGFRVGNHVIPELDGRDVVLDVTAPLSTQAPYNEVRAMLGMKFLSPHTTWRDLFIAHLELQERSTELLAVVLDESGMAKAEALAAALDIPMVDAAHMVHKLAKQG